MYVKMSRISMLIRKYDVSADQNASTVLRHSAYLGRFVPNLQMTPESVKVYRMDVPCTTTRTKKTGYFVLGTQSKLDKLAFG